MNRKDVVMFLCNYKPLYGGNFIPSLMKLEEKILQQGCTCVYVFPEEARQRSWYRFLASSGRTVASVDFSGGKFRWLRQLRQLVRLWNVTVIHMHFAPILTGELFSLLCPRVRMFIHIHSDFSGGRTSARERLMNWLRFRVFSRRIRFFSVSPVFARCNPEQVQYLPNGLAPERLRCPSVSREEMRSALHIGPDEILVELFGWSPYIKGVDVAVRALALLEKEGLPVRLGIICGADPDEAAMRAWIREHTDCPPDDPGILFLPPREDVFAYHRAADFLLSASRSEGFPYSILEMLSIGKPCIVSDIPGVRWAGDWEIVRTFDSENHVQCARVLAQAIASPVRFSEAAAEAVKQKYSIEAWVDSIVEQYALK